MFQLIIASSINSSFCVQESIYKTMTYSRQYTWICRIPINTYIVIYYIEYSKSYSPGNLNCRPPINGSGANRCGPNANGWKPWCRSFDRGSRGPSTVTLMALLSVVTWTGHVDMHMVRVKLLPASDQKRRLSLFVWSDWERFSFPRNFNKIFTFNITR